MKTHDQALTEWTTDRIDFQIDKKRYFTREEFLERMNQFTAALDGAEFSKRGHALEEDFKKVIGKLVEIVGMPKARKILHPLNIARYESLEEFNADVFKPILNITAKVRHS